MKRVLKMDEVYGTKLAPGWEKFSETQTSSPFAPNEHAIPHSVPTISPWAPTVARW